MTGATSDQQSSATVALVGLYQQMRGIGWGERESLAAALSNVLRVLVPEDARIIALDDLMALRRLAVIGRDERSELLVRIDTLIAGDAS